MKKTLLGVATTLACCAFGMACVTTTRERVYIQPAAPAMAPSGAEVEPFYDDLAPYGEWVHVSGPGWAWIPYDVSAGWRPYQHGRWIYTDYGWTWASDESFGWAVYHYGRWHRDPGYGWVWVPGTEWGPAWVAWHEGGGYVGWAPLPWQVRWRAGVGLDWGGLNVHVALGPSSWYFVQARDIVAPNLRHCIVPASRNVTLIQISQHVTNYVYVDNRIVDRSVKKEKIGRAVGHTIPSYRVRQADSPDAARGGKVKGEEFVVFRPDPSRRETSHKRGVPPGHDGTRPRNDRHPDATPNDAEPKRRPVPPGHDALHPRNDSEQEDTSPADESRIKPHQRGAPESESTPQSSKPDRRPSRTPNDSESTREGSPEARPPAAKDTPVRPGEPATEGAEAPPVRDRSQSGGTETRREGTGQSGKPDSVGAPSDRQTPVKTPPGKPAQAKKPAGKSKGKKPVEAAPKPEDAKPDKPDPEDKKSDDSKSE